jgi:hypothetical protein
MKKIIISVLLCLSLGMMSLTVLAGAPADHDCSYPEGSIWCLICDEPMEHPCFSTDGNSRCDLCDRLIAHTCHDQDGNGSCDLCTRPCENTGYLPGDITGEGTVNMADVATLYAHIKGTKILSAENGLARCDITADGKINMADMSALYAHIKGTSPLW